MAAFTTRVYRKPDVGIKRKMVGFLEFHGITLAAAGGAEVIDSAIVGNGEEPGADNAFLRVEGLQAVPNAKKRFVHEVLGDAGVTHDVENESVGDAAVAVVELWDGLRFAALEANDDCFVNFGAAKRQQDGWLKHSELSVVHAACRPDEARPMRPYSISRKLTRQRCPQSGHQAET